MRFVSNRDRAVHFGQFPLERVPRAASMPDLSGLRDAPPPPSATPLGRIVNEYVALFEQFRAEPPTPERAPYPEDPARLANELKTWWTDLEIVEGKVVAPRGTNRRDLAPHKPVKTQEIAYYPAAAMPPPDAKAPVPVDRKAALAATLETPAAARARTRRLP